MEILKFTLVAICIFAGNVSGIQRWNDNYYHQIKLWEQKGWFLGKDQPIMSKTCEQTETLYKQSLHTVILGFTFYTSFIDNAGRRIK